MKLDERKKEFQNPGPAFRAKPFWAWNGKLEEKELLRQVDILKEMGFGGYFMHSRMGLETEYLGEEWFSLINSCADYGHAEGMENWLYDEDRWPSGSAGGMVTRYKKYRAKFLEMTLLDRTEYRRMRWTQNLVAVFACRMEEEILYSKRRLCKGDRLEAGETAVVFRKIYAEKNDNYNGYCYVDTMSREATDYFLKITHEKYRKKCGKRLGTKIQGIFTDEPHRGPCFTEFSGGSKRRVPYTDRLFEEFASRFGYELTELLPELFLQKEIGEVSCVTRDYFELCQELFLENFAMPIQEWCRENHMLLTGHVLHEDSLCCQATIQGSLMRYMDDPGIDILSEYNTCYWAVTQVSSVARQLGKKWVLSELDGCTGWQMNFQSHKNIGDWQALLGINLRCPHLSWYTMKGEAKRDYPASILHQSPWYREYRYVEDYFSRIHTALSDGKNESSLLVMNPIESVWLGHVFLLPKGFTIIAYEAVAEYKDIWVGYRNTLFYTIVGTLINMVLTICAAYPLARKDFMPRNVLMFFFMLTMYFSGGLIPTYLVVNNLHLTNTVWAMIIPGAVSIYNVIITRTYFVNSITKSLEEAAELDGANTLQLLIKVVLPLSKPILAVIGLYYAVGHWNDFYTALLYINKKNLLPLQSFLRDLLMSTKMSMANMQGLDAAAMEAKMQLSQTLKYSVIIVSTIPVLCIYPFIQKYFVKGVMIGSVKG